MIQIQKLFFLTLLSASSLSGCIALKASPAADSGFLPHARFLVEMRERAPFNGIWYATTIDYEDYKSQISNIHIAPVRFDTVKKDIEESKRTPDQKIQRIEEAEEVARYIKAKFEMAIDDYPEKSHMLASVSGDDTLVLELALVELKPTTPAINAVGTVAGFFVPGGGLLSLAGKGSIAIEGIVRDGSSGEILFEFKDRESDKSAAFTVKDYQEYAHVREAIEDWAAQWAELLATTKDHMVDDSLPVTLDPV